MPDYNHKITAMLPSLYDKRPPPLEISQSLSSELLLFQNDASGKNFFSQIKQSYLIETRKVMNL